MQAKMKEIGRKMSIRMGILMSFSLSLIGTLTSGHFSVPGFLISFVLSTVVSLIIGFLVPIGLINMKIAKKHNLEPGKIKTRCVEALVSDLVYTPVMTLVMTILAYTMAMKQSGGMAQISFLPMFLRSLLICFVAGFILILVFMPIFLRRLMRNGPEKD